MSVVSQEGGRREKVCTLQKKQYGRASAEREGIPTGTGSGVEGDSMWLRLSGDKPIRFASSVRMQRLWRAMGGWAL